MYMPTSVDVDEEIELVCKKLNAVIRQEDVEDQLDR